MYLFDSGWGSTPGPTGEAYSAPPDSLAGFKGPCFYWNGVKGKGRETKEGHVWMGRKERKGGGMRGRRREEKGGEASSGGKEGLLHWIWGYGRPWQQSIKHWAIYETNNKLTWTKSSVFVDNKNCRYRPILLQKYVYLGIYSRPIRVSCWLYAS